MSDLFRTRLKAAKEGKYFPGVCEIVYDILSSGSSLSRVYSELFITPSVHEKWLEQHDDYRIAVELGLHAAVSNLEQTGLTNLEAQFFQSRVWEKLVDRASDKVGIQEKSSNEINIRFESIDS